MRHNRQDLKVAKGGRKSRRQTNSDLCSHGSTIKCLGFATLSSPTNHLAKINAHDARDRKWGVDGQHRDKLAARSHARTGPNKLLTLIDMFVNQLLIYVELTMTCTQHVDEKRRRLLRIQTARQRLLAPCPSQSQPHAPPICTCRARHQEPKLGTDYRIRAPARPSLTTRAMLLLVAGHPPK